MEPETPSAFEEDAAERAERSARERTEAWAKREEWIIIALSLVAAAANILAWIPALRPAGETIVTWYPRTGALTTICAVMAQLRLNRYSENVQRTAFTEDSWRAGKLLIAIPGLSLILTVVTIYGTLVWAYGDVWMKFIGFS